MYILEVDSNLIKACGDPGLATILQIIQKILGIIQVVVPIILIVGASWILIKMMLGPDDKKIPKTFFNCVFAAIIVIFIPYIVNLAMSWLDDSFNVTACWNVAKDTDSSTVWNEPGTQSDSGNKKPLPGKDEYKIN